jgi:hypothetical protein
MQPAGGEPGPANAGGPELAARLALGLAEIGGRAAGGVARRIVPRPPRRAAAAADRMSSRLAPVGAWVEPFYRRGVAEQERNRELARAALRALVATVATSVLDEIDLDGIADRIDVGRLVDRVDLDEVVARVDLDRVVERVDLSRVARLVLEEVDLEQVIRESTSSLADDTLDDLRARGTSADHLVGRIADRFRRHREVAPPGANSRSGQQP